MKNFDAEAIIAYDLDRRSPEPREDIHHCLRHIENKPHRAPLYIADLLMNERRRFEAILAQKGIEQMEPDGSPQYLPTSFHVDFSGVGTGLPRTRGLTGGGRISTKRLLQYLDEISAYFSVDPEDLKSILSVKYTVKIESE